MNKEIDNLINKPIKDDLSNWNITDIQLMKSYLVNLQHQLEEKEEYINIMSEAFDELKMQKQDYTQINILEMKSKEKDKVIDEAINYINKHRAGFVQPMKYIELREILERGKDE